MADTQLILKTLVEGTADARKSLDNVTKGLDEMAKSTKGVDKLSTSLQNNAEGFKNIGLASGVAFAGIVALGTMSVMQASKMQDLRQQFDTLLGSAEKGKKLFLEVQKMAALTPFTSEDLARSTSTMLGFGVAQEKVLPLMKQLGDISLGNSDRFQRLSLAFAQVSAAGKLTGQDLLQMVNAGFNPLQEISKKTGQSISDLKDQMADGAISTKMVEEAMKSATEEGGRFAGGMEKASKTFSGVMSTFRDNIGITLAALGGFANGEMVEGGLLDTLTKAMQKIMPILDRVTKWANENPEVARNILLVAGAVTGLVAGIVSIGLAVAPVIASVKALIASWGIVTAAWTFITTVAVPALIGALGAISAPVWIIIGVIAALIAAGVALYQNWDVVKAKAIEIWNQIVAKFQTVYDRLKFIWEAMKLLVQVSMIAIGVLINTGLEAISLAWNNMWSGLGGAVTTAWEFAKKVVKDSVNWIIDKVNTVINAINSIASAGRSFGISAPTIPNIPRLAEGGIVTKPTLAMIGEGGESEAVIPLSKMKNMGGGGTTNIYFSGTFGQGVAEELGDYLVRKLGRSVAI